MFGILVLQIANNMKYVVSRITVIGVFVITAVAMGVIGLVIFVAAVVVDAVVVIFTFQFPDVGSSLMIFSSNSGRHDPSPQSTTAVWMTR